MGGTTYNRDDVDSYYNRGIEGAGLVDGQPNTEGVVAGDVKAEIDAGWPVLALMTQHSYNSGAGTYSAPNGRHVFPIFGYKEEQIGGVDRLWLLAYDTWYQDGVTHNCYSTLLFPTDSEAQNSQIMGLTRYGISPTCYYKLYAFAFMHVNNNPRCPDPIASDYLPSGNYDDEFDINFDLAHDYYHIHYDYAKDPNPDSPALTLDGNGEATFHIENDCSMYFRTYRDADPPNGYLASKSIHRVYSVWTANKNVKKWEDGHSVTTVNGIVTHVVDANHFYFEERDKRLFGILVEKTAHGLSIADDVEVVIGTITTAGNGERYIEATTVEEPQEPSGKTIRPFGMKSINAGGGDYRPAGGSGTGYGQAGVLNGCGANSVGLLVRITGKVTDVDTNDGCFTISDGSGATDSADNAGVKVSAVGLTLPALNNWVTATGICSVEKPGGAVYPVVLARGQGDLLIVQ